MSNRREYLRQWTKNNPEKVKLHRAMAKLKFYLLPESEQRKYYRDRRAAMSPEAKRKYMLYHKVWQWKKRGIKGLSLKIYEETLKKQKNKCKICKIEMKTPHSDHCHKTGKFRALLCAACNLAYAQFEKYKEEFNKYDL